MPDTRLCCLPAAANAAWVTTGDKLKTVIFIRHGESEYNLACTGPDGNIGMSPVGGPDGSMSRSTFDYEDAPLTAKGRDQALRLGPTLASSNIELVVASPLERTIETASLIFPPGQIPGGKIVAYEGVREMMMPARESVNKRRSISDKTTRWEWVDWTQIQDDDDTTWERTAAAGRERSAQVHLRVSNFLNWVMGRPEQVVAVVTHGFVMQLVFSAKMVSKIFAVEDRHMQRVAVHGTTNNCATHKVVFVQTPAAAAAAATIAGTGSTSSHHPGGGTQPDTAQLTSPSGSTASGRPQLQVGRPVRGFRPRKWLAIAASMAVVVAAVALALVRRRRR
eukprot:COSAG05_NODE_1601_length_4438_cov_383.363909_1_plen_336_part_00